MERKFSSLLLVCRMLKTNLFHQRPRKFYPYTHVTCHTIGTRLEFKSYEATDGPTATNSTLPYLAIYYLRITIDDRLSICPGNFQRLKPRRETLHAKRLRPLHDRPALVVELS